MDLLRLLLDRGAYIEAFVTNKSTPLMIVGQVEIAQLLIDRCASIDAVDGTLHALNDSC